MVLSLASEKNLALPSRLVMYFARSLIRLLAVNSTLLVIEAHVACTLDLPSSFGGKTASTAPIEFGGEKKGGSLSLRSEERLE